MKTLARYLLIQLPSWVITAGLLYAGWKWLRLPAWIAVGLWLAYVAKDFALFPFLRRAYEAHWKPGPVELIGSFGEAVELLGPDGYVRVRGELWKAEVARGAASPIAAGTRVRVQAVRENTLLVMAVAD